MLWGVVQVSEPWFIITLCSSPEIVLDSIRENARLATMASSKANDTSC